MKATSLAHYIGGCLAGLVSVFNPALTALLTALFIIYETYEGWELRDDSYVDIREYLLGLFTAALFILIWGWWA
ncbi:MAG: hypothetical protein QW282_06270 [Nitrososphaerales archaeon]